MSYVNRHLKALQSNNNKSGKISTTKTCLLLITFSRMACLLTSKTKFNPVACVLSQRPRVLHTQLTFQPWLPPLQIGVTWPSRCAETADDSFSYFSVFEKISVLARLTHCCFFVMVGQLTHSFRQIPSEICHIQTPFIMMESLNR